MVKFRWLTGLLIAALATAVPAAAVQISLPDVTAAPGEKILVPVQIDAADTDAILSGNFDIRFDSDIVVVEEAAVVRSGTLASGWSFATNPRPVPNGGVGKAQILIGAAASPGRVSSFSSS